LSVRELIKARGIERGMTPLTSLCLGLLCAAFWPGRLCGQNAYIQHNLVSDLPGVADVTDANLLNPWGIAFSATGPFWISDNHAGLSTIYNSSGTPSVLIVNIPPPTGGTPPAGPSGIIFNGTSGFTVASNAPAHFIFATEDGTIVGWNSGTNGVLKVDNSKAGNVYKGLAIGKVGTNSYIYATDFHNGKIDAFDNKYAVAGLTGSFSDPTIPAGFAPFGIEAVNGQLIVTYAKQDAAAHDDVAGPGNGFVNVFDTNGQLIKRLVSNGVLNSPWGTALAPSGFGPFSGALLIGNFGDGHVNAFDPNSGAFLGALTNNATGAALAVDGLWALRFGNGGSGGENHTLYFTAGIPGGGALEDHGLFGIISAVFPVFTLCLDKGLAASVNWGGGQGSYLLQKKSSLDDTNWFDVLTTSSHSALVAKDGESDFWQVAGQSGQTVLPLTVYLSGASEVPGVQTAGNGIGTISVEGSNFNYHISFSGLTSPAIAAHLHGAADANNNANVLFALNGASGTSGTLSGTQVLTPDELADIINGVSYVNIHTTINQGGEIRGQVVPLHIPVTLNGSSEVPSVTTPATGTASLTLIGNQLLYTVNYSGLVGPAILSHIHGPAPAGSNAPVIVPFNTPSGTSGSISGTATLTTNELAYLLAGQTYVNVHSTTNAGGEIRGQINPMQFAVTMNGASEVPPTPSLGTATGLMSISNSVLFYTINFTNLLSPAIAAHIHGPADTAHNAGVLIPFTNAPTASSGTISGTAVLSSQDLLYLVTGQTYANIHTTNYSGGEIRGQILPNN
jgi:uncharacterized protein (TIGR03118 family)